MAGTLRVAGSLWGAAAVSVAVLVAAHGLTARLVDRAGGSVAAPAQPVPAQPTARMRPAAVVGAGGSSRRLAPLDSGSASAVVSTWGAAANRWRRVHCVDGSSGEPMVGVEIHVLPRTRSACQRLETAIEQSADPRGVVQHLGVQAVSDRGGAVRLPLPEAADVLLLAASEHGFASMTALTGAPGPWELELWPVRHVAVQLFDVRGEPVSGAELIVSYRWPAPMRVASNVTDAPGVARFGIGAASGEMARLDLSLAGPAVTNERLLTVLDDRDLSGRDTPLVVRLPAEMMALRPRGTVTLGAREVHQVWCGDPRHAEPLLRGRVCDDGGQPLAGVLVSWVEWGCNALDAGGWFVWEDAQTFTAVDGTFQLSVDQTARPGALRLHRADLVPHHPGIPPGGHLDTITMRGRCDVFGAVRLPADVTRRDVELVARIGMSHLTVPLDADGSFVLSLYPFRPSWGRGLTLWLQGKRWAGEPLEILDMDALAPGSTELGTIDLRSQIASTQLEVRGKNGLPVQRVQAVLPGVRLPVLGRAGPSTGWEFGYIDSASQGERWVELVATHGRYRFHHRRAGVDLSVLTAGSGPTAVHLEGGVQRLVLGWP